MLLGIAGVPLVAGRVAGRRPVDEVSDPTLTNVLRIHRHDS